MNFHKSILINVNYLMQDFVKTIIKKHIKVSLIKNYFVKVVF